MEKNARICVLGGGPAGVAAAMYLQVKGYTAVDVFERESAVCPKLAIPIRGSEMAHMDEVFTVTDNSFAIRELEKFGGTEYELCFGRELTDIEPVRPGTTVLDGSGAVSFGGTWHEEGAIPFGETEPEEGAVSFGETEPEEGAVSFGETEPEEGAVSFGETEPEEGAIPFGETGPKEGAVTFGKTGSENVAVSLGKTGPGDGAASGRGNLAGGFAAALEKAFGELRKRSHLKRLARLLAGKYRGYDCYGHVGLSGGSFFGLSREWDNHLRRVRGKNRNLKDLALPFAQFLRLNKVEGVLPLFFEIPLIKERFGDYEEVPAAYVLKNYNLDAICDLLEGVYCSWEGGAWSVFFAVNEKLLTPVHTKTEVVKVRREEGKVLVTLLDQHGVRQEVYDCLLVTSPLEAFAEIADVSGEERELFGKIRHGAKGTGVSYLSCTDYAGGWYDRLEALQGSRATFYGGAILSSGSLEDACGVSRDLVGRFF